MSSAVYKALSIERSFQPDDKSGSDRIFQHQERRQNKGPARDDGRQGGAGLEHLWSSPGMKPSITSGLELGRANPRIQRAKCKVQGHLQGQKCPRALRRKQESPGLTPLETVLSTVCPLQSLPTPTHLASYPHITCSKGIILCLDHGFYVHHNNFPALREGSPDSDELIGPVLRTVKAVPIPMRVSQIDTSRQ